MCIRDRVDMVRKVAANVFFPFTVGGGIRTVDDFRLLLREGADKISIKMCIRDSASFRRQCRTGRGSGADRRDALA